jgi:hypothetical protein
VNLYVEAFLAGLHFAAARCGNDGREGTEGSR